MDHASQVDHPVCSVPSHVCQHAGHALSLPPLRPGFSPSVPRACRLCRAALACTTHTPACLCMVQATLKPAHSRPREAHRNETEGLVDRADVRVGSGCRQGSPGADQAAADCAGQRWGCTISSWPSWWWPTPSWTPGSASWSCRPWPKPPASLCAGAPARMPCAAWEDCWGVVSIPTACQSVPAWCSAWPVCSGC